MKAVHYSQYGTPDVLQYGEVDKPIPKENELLIRTHAVSLNGSDFEFLQAKPVYVRAWGMFKPKNKILGSDIAGIVEAVGEKVSHFSVGDEVLGDVFESWGGTAEYVCAKEKQLIHKPSDMSFTDAAAIPQAGVVALQGLTYKGGVKKGMKIAILGAGGGAGTFAIQLAKSLGAEITAVDNGNKQELMKSLGADRVVDYTKEDFTENSRYDFILDFVARSSLFKMKKALLPQGTYVIVGGTLPRLLAVALFGPVLSLFSSKKFRMLVHLQNQEDMKRVVEMCRSKQLTPVIHKIFPMRETAEAFRCLIDGESKGKVVISTIDE